MWHPNCSSCRAALDEQGVWYCDDAVAAADSSALRGEIIAAHAAGLLRQSGNRLAVRNADGERAGVDQEKPNVFEADVIARGAVERPELLTACPTLQRLLDDEDDLRWALNGARPDLKLDKLEQAKVQVNTGGGGAFPFHFDVSSAPGDRRVLTAILYLNPQWADGDGGEVEFLGLPFPDVVVPPLHQRLVVFASNTLMHRVRPFTPAGTEGRVCINLWFEGSRMTPFPPALPSAEGHDERVLRVVRALRSNPAELRAFCKVWYADAIAESFRGAFSSSPELDGAVHLHHEEADEVRQRISPATMELMREALPLQPRATCRG